MTLPSTSDVEVSGSALPAPWTGLEGSAEGAGVSVAVGNGATEMAVAVETCLLKEGVEILREGEMELEY